MQISSILPCSQFVLRFLFKISTGEKIPEIEKKKKKRKAQQNVVFWESKRFEVYLEICLKSEFVFKSTKLIYQELIQLLISLFSSSTFSYNVCACVSVCVRVCACWVGWAFTTARPQSLRLKSWDKGPLTPNVMKLRGYVPDNLAPRSMHVL